MGAVADAIGGAISFVSDVISSVVNNITSAISRVTSTIGNILSIPVSYVVSNISRAFDEIDRFIHQNNDWIRHHAGGALVWINRWYKTIITSVTSNILNNIRNLWNTISNIRSFFTSRISSVLHTLYSKVAFIYSYIRSKVSEVKDYASFLYESLWRKVKSVISGVYSFIRDKIAPIYVWVKERIKSAVNAVKSWIEPKLSWLFSKLKAIYEIYKKYIAPVVTKIVDTVHKVAVITEVYRSIREGKILKAFLQGIAIADAKLASVISNIAKKLDTSVKSFAKLLGITSGIISKMLSEVQVNVKRIYDDVARIIKNTNIGFLKKVADVISFVDKNILEQLRNILTSQNSTLKSIIATLTYPVTDAILVIRETYRDYHKYETLVRVAELRKYNAITPRAYFPLLLIEGFRR